MTETQQLIRRIHAVAKKLGRAPSTISAAVLSSGSRLAELEQGKTITLAKYEFAQSKLDELEREIAERGEKAA